MATGHDAHDDHDESAHGDDAHADHAPDGDAWVVPPLLVGLVIGIALAVFFGLQSGAAAFN